MIIGGRALLMLIAARFSGPGSGKDLLSRAISLIASGDDERPAGIDPARRLHNRAWLAVGLVQFVVSAKGVGLEGPGIVQRFGIYSPPAYLASGDALTAVRPVK